MASFETIDQLERAVKNKLRSNMDKHVRKVVNQQITKSIQKVVYDAYKPVEYGRKRTKFLSDGNFKYNTIYMTDGIRTRFGHQAHTKDGEDLTTLIILGQEKARNLSGVAHYNDRFIRLAKSKNISNGGFWTPRNYMGHAYRELRKSGVVAKELKRGFD